MMIIPQFQKLSFLVCLWRLLCTRVNYCAGAMEWTAPRSEGRMVFSTSHPYHEQYFGLDCALSPWRSYYDGCTNSSLGTHYWRTLPPPWLLCFAWKPNGQSLKLRAGPLLWWGMVLSSPVWRLSLGEKDLSNWYSKTPTTVSQETWVSLEHQIFVRYYLFPKKSELLSSIIDIHLYDYINRLLCLLFFQPFSIYSCQATGSSVLCSLNIYLSICWVLLVFFMAPKEKIKPKITIKNALLNWSDPTSSKETNNDGSVIKSKISSRVEEQQKTGNDDSQPIIGGKLKKMEAGDPSVAPNKMDVVSFFNKLSKVKENFQCLKDSSLFAFLIGKHHEFKKKTNKLKYDWKNLKGSVDFIDRQAGWFEIRFANPNDKTKIWEGRPYHLFSQLLLLKPWSPTFDPTTEPISFVDMWVRIPSFPPEYYNFDSINTILHFNNVGRLLKLDPNAPKHSWAKFARFCINLDCSHSINKEIVIPDENGKLKKYNLWFEDIPQGCGNCGAGDHNFNSCPLRKLIPPKTQNYF